MNRLLRLLAQVCALCRASSYEVVKEFADGIVVGRCGSCGLVYTPIRHPEPQGVLAENDLDDLKVLSRPIVKGIKEHYRSRNFKEYLDHIGRYARGRRLLDVGCGQGFFLAGARERGYVVTGLEPNRAVARFGHEVLHLVVFEGRLGDVDLGEQQWDVVTFTDSLEYLPEPVEDLRKVIAHLVPRGIVFIKVPNGDYFLLRHAIEKRLGRRVGIDEAFGPSRRIVHYTAATLRRLVEVAGLKLLGSGTCQPIDSPTWSQWTGLELEMEGPTFVGWPLRLARRTLHTVGQAEAALFRGRNHLAQSVFVVAARPE